MQDELDEIVVKGNRPVWFGVAAELNKLFASRAWMLGPAFGYMNDLGIYLLGKNQEIFNDVKSGKLALTGQDLDNFLVQNEQVHVQSFTLSRYPDGVVPAHVAAPVNLAFAIPGRYYQTPIMQAGISYVENMYKQDFNFWDTSHRIGLGESMMSIQRHGM